MFCAVTVAALLTANTALADGEHDHLLTHEMKLKRDWESLQSVDFYLSNSRCIPAWTIVRGMHLKTAEPHLRGLVKVHLCLARRNPKRVDEFELKRALQALDDLAELVPNDPQIAKDRAKIEAELRAL